VGTIQREGAEVTGWSWPRLHSRAVLVPVAVVAVALASVLPVMVPVAVEATAALAIQLAVPLQTRETICAAALIFAGTGLPTERAGGPADPALGR
jgi:hypothetical protein